MRPKRTTLIGRFIMFAAIMLVVVAVLSIFGFFSTSKAHAGWPAPRVDTSDPEADYAIYNGAKYIHSGGLDRIAPIGTKENPSSTGLSVNVGTYDFVNKGDGTTISMMVVGGLPESNAPTYWIVMVDIRNIKNPGNIIAYDNDCDGVFEDINHISDVKIRYIPICHAKNAGIDIETEQRKWKERLKRPNSRPKPLL